MVDPIQRDSAPPNSNMLLILGAFLQLVALVHAQTVYLAGDSTMAKNGSGAGTGTDGQYRLFESR